MHEDYRLTKKAKEEQSRWLSKTLNRMTFTRENFADLFELVDALREQLADLNKPLESL